MKIKKGANIQGLNIVMRNVLIEADKIWENIGQELVVTAGLDGEHSAGSLHYYGLAVDVRTRYFSPKENAAYELKKIISRDFDVIVHNSHIHIEYDPETQR